MKHLVLKTKYVVLALFVAFSFSCSPEDGEQGPAGQDGNANIIESNWMQIQFDETNAADDYGSMIISNSDIENYINTGGVLLMYIKVDQAGEIIIYPLPVRDEFTYVVANVPSQGVENAIFFSINTSTVSDYENTPLYTIKYVIIPPAVVTAGKSLDYSKMPYNEVQHLFGLEK
ncbi:hypothetical protein [Lacinutrix chionoecetis]